MSASGITRACLLTPSGRGAVAVVVVDGSESMTSVGRYFLAANGRLLDEQPLERIVYGHWGGPGGEDLVVCRRSNDTLEIHCHGGSQSSSQIVADLSDAGCTVIESKEWMSSHDACPLAASAHLALTQATTLRTATLLLAQYHGALRSEIETLAAECEASNTHAGIARLQHLLRYAEFGQHLTKPWRVVIAGRPNVGKSSLINALVGYERAIVFDRPGTTRDVVSSTTAIDGWPVELSDTAGLHKTTDPLETAGIKLAREQLLAADLVLWVLDAVVVSSPSDCSKWDLAQQQADAVGVRLDREKTRLVLNKVDLTEILTHADPLSVETCALTGVGIDQLLSTIARRLVPTVPPPGAAVPFTAAQVRALQATLAACRREDRNAALKELHQLLVLAPKRLTPN